MFRAVRHWWSGGRGKVTARLFLFELGVVILGVLIAQGLASWVQDRADARRANEERTRIEEEIARSRANAQELVPILKCFDQRLDWILDQARSGRRFTRAELARPAIPRYPVSPTPADLEPVFREHLGTAKAEEYGTVIFNQVTLDQFFPTLRDGWSELDMLDPSWGPPGGADPAGVRRSALRLRLAIDRMIARAKDVEAGAADLGIAPHFRSPGGVPVAIVRDCRTLWSPDAATIGGEGAVALASPGPPR